MTEQVTLWVLTDGRAGNEQQALGLAEAIARQRPAQIEVKRITLKAWACKVPPRLSHLLGARRKGWPFSGLAEGGETLHWPWPDLVIGAGRRAAPIVAAIRQLHGVAAVQILDPQMSPGAFDAVVVPEHDALTGANVLHSVGAMTRLTGAAIAEAAAAWQDRLGDLPTPRLAVLIGGPSKSAEFTAQDEQRVLLTLQTLARRYTLLITPSRRTPDALITALTRAFAGTQFLWDGEGDNPYPAILGHADAVLVTEDSVNMASEAASTGLPVHIIPVTRVAPKIARFHDTLARYGATHRFTGEIGTWDYAPLAATDRVAGDLLRRGVL